MIDEASIEKVLRPLIEVDTSNPPGENYGKLLKIVEEQVAPTGCEVQLLRPPEERVKELSKESENVAGERVNLVATLSRGQGKTVVLNGHIDVVPAVGEWTYPPFELTKKGKLWYGRGVSDMKGPLATLVLAFRELAENKRWNGKIILAATIDEEIGGYTGMGYLFEEGLVRGDYCIVADGDATNIVNAANGCLRIRVRFKGKAVHSSMNWRGVNAIEKAAKLATRLEKYNASLLKKRSKVHANADSGTTRLRPSVTTGVIRGGTKVNVVPDECVVEIDRRVIPEEDKAEAAEEFKGILKELAAKDKDFKYDLLIGGFHNAFITPPDNPLIKALKSSYRQVRGESCSVVGTLGCVDASYAARAGVPAAVFGASRIENNVHGLDEKVRIADLVSLGPIVEKTVLKLMR